MAAAVFDTNILIDWLNRRPEASAELEQYARHSISRVTWSEVLAGEPLQTRNVIQRLIEPFEIVEIDARIAAVASDIRHQKRIKLLDAFILATARVNELTLVTRNTKDFPPGTPGIRIPYIL